MDASLNDPVLRIEDTSLPWREIDGEIVALDLATSIYLTVNGSGTVLWRALSEGSTRSDLIAALVDRFGIEPAVAEVDVDDFVESCRSHGILRSG